MSERCYLGVDLGAESGRVIAGLFDGQQVKLQPVHRFKNGTVSVCDTLRWDVLRLWSEIQDGLIKAGDEFGDSVASIGVDTWGVDYVLLTKEGEFVGQPFHYRDTRTRGIIDKAAEVVSREEIFEITGLQFLEFNTLFQLYATKLQNPRMLEIADQLLMMPDFFHRCLSGATNIEFTNATTTQCLDAASGNWSTDLLNKMGLPTDIFPDVVATGGPLGPLRESLAAKTGLQGVNIVASATHDTGAAVAAVPTQNTGNCNWAYISSGTWSLMGVEVANAIRTPRALELNVTNEGGIDGTYRLLKNIMGLWLVQECRRSFARQGKDYDYGQLAQMAVEAKPFQSLVEPDSAAFLSPQDMPTAIGDWCRKYGEPVPESPGAFVRCALESLALKYRQVLDWLEELTGTPVEVVHIVGGGSQNELLNQLTANACGKPVVAGPVEATVLGNVLVQARSANELSSLSDIRDVVRNSSELKTFEPTDQDAWQAAYSRFQELRERGEKGWA